VRYGMFLCRDRVEPVIAHLIRNAPHVEARRYLVDVLADYDVPFGPHLSNAIKSRLQSDSRWEFFGATFALLRDNHERMEEEAESWFLEGWLEEGERRKTVFNCINDLRERMRYVAKHTP